MEKLEKLKLFGAKKADAAADIALINQYSVKELTPDDVYCFSVILCDNDVDRDNERFTNATLDKFAELFLGKTGITDHQWSAANQMARLYRVEVEKTKETNSLGEPLRNLKGYAYMLKNESNQPIIDAIDGGIMKEVSIGCSVKKCTCSICGEEFKFDWNTYKYLCPNGHVKGQETDGKLCVGELDEPTDAYEWSFVAVPAQKGAGVTKSVETLNDAFEFLMKSDLSKHISELRKLIPHIKAAFTDAEEQQERAKIIEENKKYFGKGRENDII